MSGTEFLGTHLSKKYYDKFRYNVNSSMCHVSRVLDRTRDKDISTMTVLKLASSCSNEGTMVPEIVYMCKMSPRSTNVDLILEGSQVDTT